MSVGRITRVKTEQTVERHKNIGGRVTIDRDRERGDDWVVDVVKVIDRPVEAADN